MSKKQSASKVQEKLPEPTLKEKLQAFLDEHNAMLIIQRTPIEKCVEFTKSGGVVIHGQQPSVHIVERPKKQ